MNEIIQIVINTSLLREIKKSTILSKYTKYCYVSEEDLTDPIKIKANLLDLLDWDKHGDLGLGLFCSKFESLKRKDVDMLVEFIQDNAKNIKHLSYTLPQVKKLKEEKVIKSDSEKQEDKRREHFCAEDYEANPYGKPAKVTIYEGRVYKSRQECMYKEGLTKNELYKYLKEHES